MPYIYILYSLHSSTHRPRTRSIAVRRFFLKKLFVSSVASSAGGWRRVWYPVRSRVQVRACVSMCVRIVRCVSYYVITMHDIGRSRVLEKK